MAERLITMAELAVRVGASKNEAYHFFRRRGLLAELGSGKQLRFSGEEVAALVAAWEAERGPADPERSAAFRDAPPTRHDAPQRAQNGGEGADDAPRRSGDAPQRADALRSADATRAETPPDAAAREAQERLVATLQAALAAAESAHAEAVAQAVARAESAERRCAALDEEVKRVGEEFRGQVARVFDLAARIEALQQAHVRGMRAWAEFYGAQRARGLLGRLRRLPDPPPELVERRLLTTGEA